jgi:hypothetical protein
MKLVKNESKNNQKSNELKSVEKINYITYNHIKETR